MWKKTPRRTPTRRRVAAWLTCLTLLTAASATAHEDFRRPVPPPETAVSPGAPPLAAPGPPRAERPTAEREPGEPPPDAAESKPQAVTTSPKRELVAGPVRARLNFVGAGVRVEAGSPAFAEITVTSDSGTPRITAEVVLETELAEIVDITGKQVNAARDESNGRRIALLAGLTKGEKRTVTVELRLRAGDSGRNDDGDAANRLKVTLRPAGDAGRTTDSTVATWPVADCAGKFYAAIESIRARNFERIGDAVTASTRRDRARPGRWLFRPPASAAASRRKCARWSRRWNPWRGRYSYRCLRWSAIRDPAPGVRVTKEERTVFAFAARLVRTRAYDPRFSRDQPYGWVSRKVANDLRRYLKQDKYPAICTGAVAFVSHYMNRMSEIHERAEKFATLKSKALRLASQRTAAAREAVKADPGGHPGWGAVPLDVISPPPDYALRDLIAELAKLAGGGAPLDDIRQAPTDYAALRIMDGFVAGGGLDSLSARTRSAVWHALALIEAADYVTAAGSRFLDLDGAIFGSLTAVKEAHGAHCTCSR